MLYNCFWISPCCAIVCEFHHVLQLFVNFTMLCYCFWITPCFAHWKWISQCCAIVCEFHHIMHLFVLFICDFTMFCNYHCILGKLGVNRICLFHNFVASCCVIINEFHHAVKLSLVGVLLRCCWGVVEVLLRCCWGVVEVLLGYCLDIVEVLLVYLSLNEEYFLTMTLTNWLTDQLNHFQSCYRN